MKRTPLIRRTPLRQHRPHRAWSRAEIVQPTPRRYGPEPKPLADRFWPKVNKGDGCWVWTGAGSTGTGYGRIRSGGRGTLQALAHRVSWEIAFGPIPDGLIVCHHCDNPRCVKTESDEQYPEGHLFLGTYADNMADATQKGRMPKGERWHTQRPLKRNWQRDGRPSRAKTDPVTAVVRWAVMHRDGQCFLSRIEADHICRDRWGNTHKPTDIKRLTIEHVKTELRMGKRAPSTMDHLLALCYGANVGVPSKEQRRAMRDHLMSLDA